MDEPSALVHAKRDGVLLLSENTGAPVVALRIQCSLALRLPTWERKLTPLPWSRVTVTYSQPLVVTRANREASRAAIARHLEGG